MNWGVSEFPQCHGLINTRQKQLQGGTAHVSSVFWVLSIVVEKVWRLELEATLVQIVQSWWTGKQGCLLTLQGTQLSISAK